MAKDYDSTLKALLDIAGVGWVRWLDPTLPPEAVIDPFDPDVSTVQMTADKVFRIAAPAESYLHLEVQSSRDPELEERMLVYNVLLHRRYQRPVRSVVFLLRREAGNLTGRLVREDLAGQRYLEFAYHAVRVWQLQADALVRSGPGLAPLAILTDDAALRLDAVADEIRSAVRIPSETEAEMNLMLLLCQIITGMRYDKETGERLFPGGSSMLSALRESSVYQAILQEGKMEGMLEGAAKGAAQGMAQGMAQGVAQGKAYAKITTSREILLDVLSDRFGNVPKNIRRAIEDSDDADRLQRAVRESLHISSIDEFKL